MANRLPLSRYVMIDTENPDVALHNMQQRQPGFKSIEPLVSRNWRLISNVYLMGDLAIVASYSRGYSIEVYPDQRVRVFMPLSGNMSLRVLGKEFNELGGSEAFFLNHSFGVTTFHPGNSLLVLTASATRLAEYLRLLDCKVEPTLLADRIVGRMNIPALEKLRRVVVQCVWEIEEGFPDLACHALFKKQREESLFLLLASTIKSLSENEAPKSSAYARIVRRSIEYIAMRFANEFSYPDLARHAGASLRSVQMAFQSEFGVTIRDWLRDYRMDKARESMRRGDYGGNVTKVALHNGFTHLGRFSAAYYARFGEYPSESTRSRAS